MTSLEFIKAAIKELPRDQQISVEKCAAVLRQVIAAFEVNGKIALALVGSEAEMAEVEKPGL